MSQKFDKSIKLPNKYLGFYKFYQTKTKYRKKQCKRLKCILFIIVCTLLMWTILFHFCNRHKTFILITDASRWNHKEILLFIYFFHSWIFLNRQHQLFENSVVQIVIFLTTSFSPFHNCFKHRVQIKESLNLCFLTYTKTLYV
jgi:hypothetical protein